MLYYSNGGPGPATKLLRVESTGSNHEAWLRAPAASWQPRSGWQPNDNVQLDILGTGEFFMVDASQVEDIQNELRAAVREFGGEINF